MKPAWYYDRQAKEAAARETYFRNKPRTTRAAGTAIAQKDTVTRFYRSLFLLDGTEHRQFRVDVDSSALTKIGGETIAGLTAVGEAGKLILSVRENLKPTRATWYSGKASPTVAVTAWGSVWTKYYDTTGTGADARSSYSMPLSSVAATFDSKDIITKFNGIFQAAAGTGGNTTLLGAKNGRASLSLEKVSTATNT